MAGHSVGELAAYVAAGVLGRRRRRCGWCTLRAQAMAAACTIVDGSMAAVIGLDEARAARGVHGASAERQLGRGGQPERTRASWSSRAPATPSSASAERARAGGARRVLPLNVGGPFHSVYMRPAADALSARPLPTRRCDAGTGTGGGQRQRAGRPRSPTSCATSSPCRSTRRCAGSRRSQRLAELGCDRFLEVGPGPGAGRPGARARCPTRRVASFGSLADLRREALLAALRRSSGP